MAKAIALTRTQLSTLIDPFEVARRVIVVGSALALIVARSWLPL